MSADEATRAIRESAEQLVQHNRLLEEMRQKIDWMCTEQVKDKDEIKSLKIDSRLEQRRNMADFKQMNPEKFAGPRGTVPFRQRGQDVKDLASRYSANLHDAMAKTEYLAEHITMERIRALGVDVEEDRQLRSTIRAFTQGEARNFVSTEINKGTTGLEVWRVLVSLYDPNNDNTRMDESTFVLNPGKAKTMSEVTNIMSKWEDVLDHRARTLGRAPLDDDLKRSVLLSILPDAESRELKNQRILYKTFEALRIRALEMVHERSTGRAPMLFSVEEKNDDDQDEWQQDGKWLFKIEARDGRKERIWKQNTFQRKGKGKGKGKTEPECYRCGRPGHIRADCVAKTHRNGGAPKEFNRKLNNLEEGSEVECEVLDICALDAITGALYFKSDDDDESVDREDVEERLQTTISSAEIGTINNTVSNKQPEDGDNPFKQTPKVVTNPFEKNCGETHANLLNPFDASGYCSAGSFDTPAATSSGVCGSGVHVSHLVASAVETEASKDSTTFETWFGANGKYYGEQVKPDAKTCTTCSWCQGSGKVERGSGRDIGPEIATMITREVKAAAKAI